MKYKTIIIKNNITNTIQELKLNHMNISNDGSIFCIIKTQYKNGLVEKDFMDVITYATSDLGLYYINTIVIPDENNCLDNVLYCVWLVRNKTEYYFNKDMIREKSIWENVEWGKRKKNYNPKGKDPGNVWIPTEDDGKANITNHLLLKEKDIYERILSATVKKNEKYFIINDNKYFNLETNINGSLKVIETDYKDICFGSLINTVDSNSAGSKIVFGTAESMDNIDNESADVVITSPPYWDLKDYYKKNQIGKESYNLYSKRMYTVWKECYKKLNNTGSMWVNINIRIRKGTPILLPQLFIKQCKEIGFKYRGILIWHKSSGIPTHEKNLSDHHEYVLIFTKSSNCKINISKIKHYKDYKNSEISSKLFWNINRKAGSVGKKTIHPAIFPTELINRIIKISTLPGDLVVDPFLGSGTSLIASVNNNRTFIGYEFNEGFEELMENRFKKEIPNYNDIHINTIYNKQK